MAKRMRFVSYMKCTELNDEAIVTYITSALRDINADMTNNCQSVL